MQRIRVAIYVVAKQLAIQYNKTVIWIVIDISVHIIIYKSLTAYYLINYQNSISSIGTYMYFY